MKLKIKSFSLDRSCSHSFLRIRDGENSSSDLLKKFCGDTFEPSVFSSGRYLWVQLYSVYDKYYASGLDAVYEAVKQCEFQKTKSRKTENAILLRFFALVFNHFKIHKYIIQNN